LKTKLKVKFQRRRRLKTRWEQEVRKDVMLNEGRKEGRTWKKSEEQQLWEENRYMEKPHC
jgi:hypothetical protein